LSCTVLYNLQSVSAAAYTSATGLSWGRCIRAFWTGNGRTGNLDTDILSNLQGNNGIRQPGNRAMNTTLGDNLVPVFQII